MTASAWQKQEMRISCSSWNARNKLMYPHCTHIPVSLNMLLLLLPISWVTFNNCMSGQMPDLRLLWKLGQKSVLIVWLSTEGKGSTGGNFDRVPETVGARLQLRWAEAKNEGRPDGGWGPLVAYMRPATSPPSRISVRSEDSCSDLPLPSPCPIIITSIKIPSSVR